MKAIIRILLTLALFVFSGLTFAKGVTVNDPYVRAIPPGQKISASFMTLINDTDKNIDLVKASSDSAKNVELHEHVHEDGMMKMRQVAKIGIAANSKTELKPGGYHIMLIGLLKHIQPKDIITINLEFSDGSRQQVKAEVRKIMMGMMKKKMGMKNSMDFKYHANPMPNLLAVFKTMGDKLDLSDEQKSKLRAEIKKSCPKIKALYASLKNLEADIYKSALNDEDITRIDQIADKIMQTRLAIIQGKAHCRENVKEVVGEKLFQKMIALYRTEIMPKSQLKMPLMKHTNPLPDFMQVVTKMENKLKLTEKQSTDLKAWRDERTPVTAKVAKQIVTLEAELQKAALNNEPLEKIDQLADSIMQTRVRMIRSKALSRNNIKRILDNEQYQKVIQQAKDSGEK
jgi:copper(I)-binding protein/predicted transcriptional regulator